MRAKFIEALIDLAREDKDVVLVTGDLGFGSFEVFEKEFPNQYFNAGIAEQSMIGISSGLAKAGKKVFVYSIGNFVTLRCLEQIRNDACYHELNITLVSQGGGFTYGALGMSHHATEDLAIMRALPNITIVAPSNGEHTYDAVNILVKRKGVGYLRLEKATGSSLNTLPFYLSKPNFVRNGEKIVIITVGSILSEACIAANEMKDRLSISVLDFSTVYPVDKKYLVSILKDYNEIITLEEHQETGGVGSLIADFIVEYNLDIKLKKMAIDDILISEVGSQSYLRKTNNINSESIVTYLLERDDEKLNFKVNARSIIKSCKDNSELRIPFPDDEYYLSPMTKENIYQKSSISLLSEWRRSAEHAFLKVFEVTDEGTQRWLEKGVLDNEDRLIFWVVDSCGNKVGHLGVSSFDYTELTCEIDNVIKAPNYAVKGLFEQAVNVLISWLRKSIKADKIKLRVFSDNARAISLYKKTGFIPCDVITFEKTEESGCVEWLESDRNIDRCFLVMELKNDK